MSVDLANSEPNVAGEPEQAEAAAVAADAEPDWLVVEPPRGWPLPNLGEIWQYRDLLSLLVWRDISAKYRQSLAGLGWTVLKPIIQMLTFTLIFGRVAQLPTDGAPQPVFYFTAILPWTYFAACLTATTSSVVSGSALLTKVYFPRLILPLATTVVGLVEFAIQFVLLLVLMAWYQLAPTTNILWTPVLLMLAAATALSVGIWLTALNVKFRDVGMLIPFVVQIWMFVSPVVYSSSMISERWRPLFGLNPMAGVIEGFRWALLGHTAPDWTIMAVSSLVVLVLLVTGLFFFRRTETTFADIV